MEGLLCFTHLRLIGKYFRNCPVRNFIMLEKVWTSFVFLKLTDVAN